MVASAKIKGIARQRHVEAHIAKLQLQMGGGRHGRLMLQQENQDTRNNGSSAGVTGEFGNILSVVHCFS